jgi:CubicO group peptidase (beta-lactamase class C family)
MKPRSQPEPKPPATATAQLTVADIEPFLDGLIPLQLEQRDIAGAVVVIVKDGSILFAKGYGYADVDKKKRVSESTLFRPGSISKLFAWTAVMQLVEQGKLDLDRDVNEYLDWRIPTAFSRPITLRNIMTHTAGFEESVKDLFVGKSSDLQPLDQYLRAHLPQRIYPPGEVPAYSNYATALAGGIVQRISGLKFEDYVVRNIFDPLQMENSTFMQPLPDRVKPLMSNGYELGSATAKPFENVQAGPAGALSTSAADIARFMMAHLQDGEWNGRRILGAETARLMHMRQSGLVPQINGMALGFCEESRNGHRIIGHGGDTQWFHSDLHLVPDQNLGFFVSYNSAGRGEGSPRAALWQKFLDRYLPYGRPVSAPQASRMDDAKKVSGIYFTSRRSWSNFLRLGFLLGEIKVTARPDGIIETDVFQNLNGQPRRFEEIGPLLYRNVQGQEKIAFIPSSVGYTIAIDFPAMVYQSVPWYQNKNLILVVIVGSVAIPLLVLLLWLPAAMVRRHYGRKPEMMDPERRLRVNRRVISVLVSAGFASWMLVFLVGMQGIPTGALDKWLRLAQGISSLGIVAGLFAIYHFLRSAAYSNWWWNKVVDALILLACLGFVGLVVFGRLMQWSLSY